MSGAAGPVGDRASPARTQDPTWAKLVRTLAVEFDQDGAFLVG
jgi:hypothetical protein